jgi:hypothetical protein
MKIGILTFHRAHNYGAVLQCYALQQYLIQLGHDTYVIDYNNKKLWSYYSWRDRNYEQRIRRNVFKLPVRLFRYIKNRRKQIVRYKKFEYFQEKILKLSNTGSIVESPYDLILIGSDQVWNTSITDGFDPYYWGTFEKPKRTKVATYAASLRKLWSEEQYNVVYDALKNLDGISVREAAVGRYVKHLFPDLDVCCVPDPVMLLSPEHWRSFAKMPPIKKKYIFFYQAEASQSIYNTAVKIALQRGLPLFVLSADQWAVNSKECHSASPQEFLGWILNAELVVTSSFHALAFCILFQKDFYAVNLNKGQDERLKNMVSAFGLEQYLIDTVEDCKPNKPYCIDQEIEIQKKDASNYLLRLL